MNGLTRAFVGLALVLTTGCAAAEVSYDHNRTDVADAHELSSQSLQAVDMVATAGRGPLGADPGTGEPRAGEPRRRVTSQP